MSWHHRHAGVVVSLMVLLTAQCTAGSTLSTEDPTGTVDMNTTDIMATTEMNVSTVVVTMAPGDGSGVSSNNNNGVTNGIEATNDGSVAMATDGSVNTGNGESGEVAGDPGGGVTSNNGNGVNDGAEATDDGSVAMATDSGSVNTGNGESGEVSSDPGGGDSSNNNGTEAAVTNGGGDVTSAPVGSGTDSFTSGNSLGGRNPGSAATQSPTGETTQMSSINLVSCASCTTNCASPENHTVCNSTTGACYIRVSLEPTEMTFFCSPMSSPTSTCKQPLPSSALYASDMCEFCCTGDACNDLNTTITAEDLMTMTATCTTLANSGGHYLSTTLWPALLVALLLSYRGRFIK